MLKGGTPVPPFQQVRTWRTGDQTSQDQLPQVTPIKHQFAHPDAQRRFAMISTAEQLQLLMLMLMFLSSAVDPHRVRNRTVRRRLLPTRLS